MQYTTAEMRKIAKTTEPQGWGKKDQALLYAADVIDAGQALIDEQKATIDAKAKEIESLRIALVNIITNKPSVGTDYYNLGDILFQNGLMDDNGNFTKLLTGDK